MALNLPITFKDWTFDLGVSGEPALENYGGYPGDISGIIKEPVTLTWPEIEEAVRSLYEKEETVSKEALEEALIRLGLEAAYTVYEDGDDPTCYLDVAQFEKDLLTTRKKRKEDEAYQDAIERLGN